MGRLRLREPTGDDVGFLKVTLSTFSTPLKHERVAESAAQAGKVTSEIGTLRVAIQKTARDGEGALEMAAGFVDSPLRLEDRAARGRYVAHLLSEVVLRRRERRLVLSRTARTCASESVLPSMAVVASTPFAK